MRDVVWTVILIWLVWRIYDVFKQASRRKSDSYSNNQNNYQHQKDGEVRIDKTTNQKPHFNANDGEYVDYEEIK